MNKMQSLLNEMNRKEENFKNYKHNMEKYLIPCYENLDLEVMPRMPGDETKDPFLTFDAKSIDEAKSIINFLVIDYDNTKTIEYGKDKYTVRNTYLVVSKKYNIDDDEFKFIFVSKRFGIMIWIMLDYLNIEDFKYTITRSTVRQCTYDITYHNKHITEFKAKCLRYHGLSNTTTFNYYPRNDEELDDLLKKIQLSEVNYE